MGEIMSTRFRFAGILFAALLPVMVNSAQASVEISTDATKNMSCSAGVCSPTAKKAVLNVNDLTNMLASGDVKITTGAGAVTITVESPFSWTSTHRLTLDAYYNVSFRAAVTVAGSGAVTITYNDGGNGGDLLFFPGASLDFWDTSSSLIINGSSYTLIRDIRGLIQNSGLGKYVALAQNYDAATDGTYADSPVSPFLSSTFEGLGHEIENLTIVSTDCCGNAVGLISINDGVVRDFSLTNADISTNPDHPAIALGTVAGENDEYGLIFGVHSSGRVSGTSTIGGLVGLNEGKIVQSFANTEIAHGAGYTEAGGLVGFQTGGTDPGVIDHSFATGTVVGNGGPTGGLVGHNEGLIAASHSAGAVSASGRYSVGGLVGIHSGTIQLSYAAGSVSGTGESATKCDVSAGGLVGWNAISKSGDVYYIPIIETSYSTGNVSGNSKAACVGGMIASSGILDHKYPIIAQTYSVGHVSGAQVGGFIGAGRDHAGSIQQSYWNLDTSGAARAIGNTNKNPGITGLTDAQLKSGLPAGFDPAVWGQKKSINNGYPYLLANPPPQ
jgi:hypothetical protein